jgi:CheY-like chemotaxis protein
MSWTQFDVAEVLTELARNAAAEAEGRGRVLLYDYEGALAVADGPVEELRSLLQHALAHMLHRSEEGCVFFGAEVHCETPHECRVSVRIVSNAASAGEPPSPAELGSFPGICWEGFAQGGAQSAIRGRSQRVPGELSLAAVELEGEVLHFESRFTLASDGPADDSADAHGARAWLIAEPTFAVSMLARRLQRLGWYTSIFASAAATGDALRAHHGQRTAPALLIGLQSGQVDAAQFAALLPELPDGAVGLLACTGPSLPEPGEHPPRCAAPLSPVELIALTRQLARPAPTPRSGDTVPGTLGREDRRHVLVVDDNAVNQLLAKEMLQMLGFEVAMADDGLQAIEHCRRESPDAVLMDLQMPRMDGLKATRELRRLQREGSLAGFPIFGVTADGTAADACVAAGMDGFMTKPIDLRELERLLRDTLH